MGDRTDALTRSRRALQTRIESDWWRLLLAVSVGVVAGMTAYRFAGSPFYVSPDSALFQHGGWYIGQGATLYVDVWDLKPPYIYVVTTGLAMLTGGNMAALHVLSVLAAVAAVAGGVIVTGLTVHRLTDDGFASVVAALSLFALTSLYTYPWAGIRPKYFAFLCGAGALYFAAGDRYLASGVAAALGAGFWQLGAGIALLVVLVAVQRGGRRAALRAIGGGVAIAVATVLPFAVTGTAIPLFVEVVLAPLYGVERYTVPGRLLQLVVEVGYGAVLVPVAAYGWWRGLRADWRSYWWVAAGGVGYFGQLFLEFQGAIELVLLYLFVALGLGVAVAEMPSPSGRSLLAVVVVLSVVTSFYWHEGTTTPIRDRTVDLRERYEVSSYDRLPPDPAGVPSMETIYWERRTPDRCHYRLGHKQKHFEQVTGGNLTKRTCGQWPFSKGPRRWLADRLWPFG